MNNKKLRLLALLLAVVMVFSVIPFSAFATEGTSNTYTVGGTNTTGTETSSTDTDTSTSADLTIDSFTMLQAFATEVNNGNDYEGKTVVLGANIVLSGEWTPIGNGTRDGKSYTGNAFKGTFDGKGYTITNLTNKSTNGDAAVGLFGVVDGGTVKNLTLANVSIDTASENAGAAIGMMTVGATASGITVSGSVKGAEVGGIVGRATVNATITNCVNYAAVTATEGAGGIVAKAYYTEADTEMTISNSTNYGAIYGSITAGGIVGFSTANVIGNKNYGTVDAGQNVGGIIGWQQMYGEISGNENTVSITTDAITTAGGIVGWVNYQYATDGTAAAYGNCEVITVTDNTNSGAITAASTALGAGGIVGGIYNAAVVTGNVSTAASVTGSAFAAGIVGNIQTNTENGFIDENVTVTDNKSTTAPSAIKANCVNTIVYDNTTGRNTVENNTCISGTITPGYTVADKIWGEATFTASASFVVKLYSGTTLLATSSLNDLNKTFFQGNNTTVTWNVPLNSAGNDEYWTVTWEKYVTIDTQPTHVVACVDGEDVATNNVQLNAPDNLNKIVAASIDAGSMYGQFQKYYTSLDDAISTANPGSTIVVLRDVTESIDDIYKMTLVSGVAGGVTVNNTYEDWIYLTDVNVNSGVTLKGGNIFMNENGVNVIEGTVETTETYYQGYDAKVTVQNGGSLVVGGTMILRYNENADSGLYVYGDGDDTTVELDVGYYIGAYSGTLYLEDATAECGYFLLRNQYDIDKGSMTPILMTLDNSTVTVVGTTDGQDSFQINGQANLTLANGSAISDVRDFNILEGAELELSVDETSGIYATNVSVADDVPFDATIENGIVKLDKTLKGEGTETNPYLIEDLEDLIIFRDTVNTYTSDGSNQFKGKYVKLTADIDLDGINWTPIGTNSKGDHMAFLGTFDGDGHTISNLYVNADGDHLGFFARVGSYTEGITPTIKNITFNNVDVSSNTTTGHGGSYVGGVVANAGGNSVIEGVHVTGDVYVVGYGYVGGIVGHGYPDITDCSLKANDGSYINCYYWCAGGIIGYAGEGGTPIVDVEVSGIDVWSAYGAAAAVAGLLQDGNKVENVTASDVEISSNSDYCMGYIAGNGEASTMTEITLSNVTATANGKEITPTDAVAKVNGTVYFDFADALEAANAGDTIYVYQDIVSFPQINKPVTIIGNGVKVTGNSGEHMFGSGINGEVKISGFVFENGNQAIRVEYDYTDVTNEYDNLTLTIDNCTFNNITTYSIMGGSDRIPDPDVWLGTLNVTNCTFNSTANNYVVYVQRTSNVTVYNCTFNGSEGAKGAIHLGDLATTATVKDNTITGFQRGVVIANQLDAGVTISGNTFDGNTYGIFVHENAAMTNANIKVSVDSNKFTNVGESQYAIYSVNTYNPVEDYVSSCTANTLNGTETDLAGLKTESAYVYPVATVDDVEYKTSADVVAAINASTKANIVVELLADVTIDITAWQTLAIGGASTETITINGNGNTLTFNKKNSDWNNIATNNGATLILNDMTITDSGYNNGPWNRYDLNFACDVELNNVVATKALAFKADATLNTVTINETGDNYAIWIQPNGQTIAIDGLTVNSAGRGIKIDDQYVDNAQLVDLTVANATFTTAKKAAILVKSTAGAEIELSNVDISGVAADPVNAVWVDAGGAADFGKVTVTGGTVAQEDATDFVAAITDANGNVLGYYKTLQEAVDAAADGETVKLLADISEDVTITQNDGIDLTIDGGNFIYSGTISIDGTSIKEAEMADESLVIQNFKFVTTEASHTFISASITNHYPHNVTIQKCSFTGTGDNTTKAIDLKSSYDCKIVDCTGTGLHSFIQNRGGHRLTIENVTVTESKSGLALGTVQNVTVKNVNIDASDVGYGIRLDAAYATTATIEDSTISAFIPVVVRGNNNTTLTEGFSLVFSGNNTMTADNTDGFWCVIGDTEYEENGKLPTASKKVNVTINDDGLDIAGVSGLTVDGITTEEELIEAINNGISNIIVSADITLNSTVTVGANTTITVEDGYTLTVFDTVTNNGTINGYVKVLVMVYVVSTENPYEGVTYDITATKNGSIEGDGTVENAEYLISLDGGKTWIADTTDGKAQAVLVKTDGTTVVYSSFKTCYQAAKTGEIVHMLTDAHVQSTHTSKNYGPLWSYYGLILEGNGHTIYTDLEASGASNEYATIKFTGWLAGTGPEVNPVLKNVTIDSQGNAKADLDYVSNTVTFTVTMYNVNLLGNCQYASFAFKSPSMIVNKSNVEIYDSTIPSWDAGSANAINIYSGEYSLALNSKCTVYGGTFTKDVTNYLADGVVMTKNADGKYVVDGPYEAKIGDVGYKTLAEAFKAAQDGDTVTLLADVTLDSNIVVSKKSITFDGQGYTISQAAGLTLKDYAAGLRFDGISTDISAYNYVIKNVVFDGWTTRSVLAVHQCTATIDNVTIKNTNWDKASQTMSYGLLYLENTEITVKNSAFVDNNAEFVLTYNYGSPDSTANLVIDNCEFSRNTVGLNAAAVYYVTGSSCTITNTEFVGNNVTTGGNGATLYLGFQENCTVTGCLFEDNTVHSTGNSKRVAGAIFFGYEAKISGNAFVNNIATNANGDELGQDVCTSTYYNSTIDLSGNYWGGTQPVLGENYFVQHTDAEHEGTFVLDSYYETYTTDENGNIVLGDVVEITYVAKVGKFSYETLAEAFAAAQAGDEVVILVAGTYSLSGISGKNITVTATVDDVVFDNIGAFNMGGANVTFNNVTFDYYPNVNYTGLQHSGNLVYNNCTINGQVFLYGVSETFNKCTFNQNSADAYNVWTYGAKVVKFNECIFNCVGKAVLVYNEGACATDLTVEKTTFVASAPAAGKAAIEIDTSLMPDGTDIVINNSTAEGFDAGSISGNTLWNDKKDQTDLTITVDDVMSWPPKADLTYGGYVGTSGEGEKYRENIQVDLYNVVATESLVVKLYDANGNLLAITTLRQTDCDDESVKLYPVDGTITANIVVKGRLAGSWDTEWLIAPSVANMPAKIEAYADGKLVATYDGGFTNASEAFEYKALTGVHKSIIATDEYDTVGYYANLDELFDDSSFEYGKVTVELLENVVANNQVDTSYYYTYNFVTDVEGGVTMDFLYADNWNYIQHASIGENITLNAPYLLLWSDVEIAGTVNTGYLYMLGATVEVAETGIVNVNTGDATVQVKGGTTFTVNGQVNTKTINVWSGASELIVSGKNAQVNASWIDIWDGTPSVTVENGAVLKTDAIKASRGGAIAVDGATLAADSVELGHNGSSAGELTVTNNGIVDSEIKLTAIGSTFTGPEGMNVTLSEELKLEYYTVAYANGVYSVVENHTVLLTMDGYTQKFNSLEEAVAAANKMIIANESGKVPEIILYKDVTITETIYLGGWAATGTFLNGNGNTITSSADVAIVYAGGAGSIVDLTIECEGIAIVTTDDVASVKEYLEGEYADEVAPPNKNWTQVTTQDFVGSDNKRLTLVNVTIAGAETGISVGAGRNTRLTLVGGTKITASANALVVEDGAVAELASWYNAQFDNASYADLGEIIVGEYATLTVASSDKAVLSGNVSIVAGTGAKISGVVLDDTALSVENEIDLSGETSLKYNSTDYSANSASIRFSYTLTLPEGATLADVIWNYGPTEALGYVFQTDDLAVRDNGDGSITVSAVFTMSARNYSKGIYVQPVVTYTIGDAIKCVYTGGTGLASVWLNANYFVNVEPMTEDAFDAFYIKAYGDASTEDLDKYWKMFRNTMLTISSMYVVNDDGNVVLNEEYYEIVDGKVVLKSGYEWDTDEDGVYTEIVAVNA